MGVTSLRCYARSIFKLAVPPTTVVKTVESASRVWPPRVPFGGMLMHELNSRFPAAVERMRTGQVDRLYGHSEPVHQRASVLAEARLAWSEVAAVVGPRFADGRLAGADLFRCRAGLRRP
jgi:hypothetical protein